MALSKIDTGGLATDAVDNTILDLAGDFAGMHFGGTGSANQFDDYETGTWTGTLTGTGANPSTAVTQTGYYTKVGNQVFVQWTLSDVSTAGASGVIIVEGLPFTADTTTATGNVMFHKGANLNNSTMSICPYIASGETKVRFYSNIDSGGWASISHYPTTAVYIWFTATYTTAA